MGSYQVKCICEEFAMNKIIIDDCYSIENIEKLNRLKTGYCWNFDGREHYYLICDECIKKLTKILIENNFKFTIKNLPNGYWKCDLP